MDERHRRFLEELDHALLHHGGETDAINRSGFLPMVIEDKSDHLYTTLPDWVLQVSPSMKLSLVLLALQVQYGLYVSIKAIDRYTIIPITMDHSGSFQEASDPCPVVILEVPKNSPMIEIKACCLLIFYQTFVPIP